MHRNPSPMQHTFSQVPKAEIPRSSFDRSFSHKTTFDAGLLIPIFHDEALPGDTFNVSMTGFGRLATPIYPLMDNMKLDVHFFAVPFRLVWDNWQKFNGEQENPGDSTDYVIPQMTAPAGGYQVGSIYDYFGLPTGVAGFSHSALPLRAYNLIWNQWYRDQNLQDSLTVPKTDGPDLDTLYSLQRRNKRHDYFTSCLPWPQKGPGVTIPLGGTAPVVSDGTQVYWSGGSGMTRINLPATAGQQLTTNANTTAGPATFGVAGTATTGLQADLTGATAATINSLRQAFQIQRIYERDARGGTRYYELIKAHFGVTDPGHAVLQRPQYLGGGTAAVTVNPVPQTSASGAYATSPQGNLAGMGTVLANRIGFTHSFTEHCLILGILSVRADLTYQQGLARSWSRKTRFDYYWPALSHIGEQAVLQKEIFTSGVPADDDKVFGYQERFAEYRYRPSQITGQLRSTFAQSLDAWHLAQEFTNAPVLDTTFIEENPPVDRVIAVPDAPHFIMDTFFKMRCARPMPVFGVPGLIDHF